MDLHLFLTWLFIMLLILSPFASAISYGRSIRRSQDRIRRKRIAEGLSAEPSTRRRWKNYRYDPRYQPKPPQDA